MDRGFAANLKQHSTLHFSSVPKLVAHLPSQGWMPCYGGRL